MNKLHILTAALGLCLASGCPALAQTARQMTVAEVTVDGGDYLTRQEWDTRFMMRVDADRLLYYFRQRAGLPNPEGVRPYGGWEGTDLKGHTLGHYLTAMSMLWAHSGNEEVHSRIEHCIEVLAECQRAMGTGLVCAYDPALLTQCETTGHGWAPYYTLHKILQGLLDAGTIGGCPLALKVADHMGDHVADRLLRITDMQRWNHAQEIMEVGGMPEAMLSLYGLTHKTAHLEAARRLHQMDKLEPAARGEDMLHAPQYTTPEDRSLYHNYYHSNTTIPQFIAACRDYQLTGNEEMLCAAENFWTNVVDHRTYANGSTSRHEHWDTPADHLAEALDHTNGETCCTYNLIRLSNMLMSVHPDARYAEYVERALMNQIMGSIQPGTANMAYFNPLVAGSFKTFGQNENIWWCCTGSGMENHQRYAESVYFTQGDTVLVCQWMPTTLRWQQQGVTLQQRTLFPQREETEIAITEGAGRFTLALRVPQWCKEFGVRVNGRRVHGKTTDYGFYTLTRDWHTGDVVQVELPMQLRCETLAHDGVKPQVREASQVALMYGPLLLAAQLGREGVTPERVVTTDNYFSNIPDYQQPSRPVPQLTGNPEKPAQWIHKERGQLVFSTRHTSDGSTLHWVPIYQVSDERMAPYIEIKK